MAQQFIEKYNGQVLSVSDIQIMEASRLLSKNTGLFAEPAAAAAFAGFLEFNKIKLIPDNSSNIVLLTGSGLKDLNALKEILTIPEPIDPGLKQLKNALS